MSQRTLWHGTILCWTVFTFLFLAFVPAFAAASGSVRGRILDRETGDPLPGANIIVVNTSIGVSTDLDGRYLLRAVPEGKQTLRVSYVGYMPATAEVTITAGGATEQDFRLTAQAIVGQTVVITAQAMGQNAAINQQLSSNTIANVVSAARIKELPDVNAAESIGRLPGVAINRSGGEASTVSIRGLSAKYNVVTVDGVRLPSSGDDRGSSLTGSIAANGSADARYGGNDRSVDLSLVSSNILDGIELKKANTPDMDADVLGGTVDLKLKEAPEELHVNLSAQGGYNQLQKYYGNYNFAGSVSDRFLDGSFGVIASANTDHYDRSADKFSAGYGQIGLTNMRINNVDLREEKVKRDRTGGSLLLDYRIPYGRVSGNLFFNRLDWKGLYRFNSMSPNANRHFYDLEDRHGRIDLFTGSATVKQDYDWISFNATIDRTGSRDKNPNERTWRFTQENTAFRVVPSTTDPHLVVNAATVDSGQTGLADIYVFDTRRDENQTTAQLNVQMPFRFGEFFSGYIKAGGKFRWLNRLNDEEVSGANGLQYGGSTGLNRQIAQLLRQMSAMYPQDWNWVADSTLARQHGLMPVTPFLGDYSRSNFLNGDYPLGLAVDDAKMQQVTNALASLPSDVFQRYTVQSMGRDYDGIERYQAGYLMSEINLGEYVTFIPGVRWEKDFSRYHGQRYRAVAIGGASQGAPLDYTPVTARRSNEFWLPQVHLILKPFEWLKVRLAGTQTLTRPDFRQYAPITYITAMQDQIVATNYSLKPARSTNYDAALSVFDNSIGLFTVSGFYKKITDLVFYSGYSFGPGVPPPPGSSIPSSWLGANPAIYSYAFNNPYPATIKGFELEWQTHFWYLPSFLQGLVLNVNYTRIFSEVRIREYFTERRLVAPRTYKYVVIDSSRTARVPDQPAHIANITIGYDFRGFSTRLSYLYQTDRVSGIDKNPSLDSFTGPYARWDLTVQQKLDWGITLFANLNNLNARPDRSLRGSEMVNPTYIEYYGFTMDIGIRFSL